MLSHVVAELLESKKNLTHGVRLGLCPVLVSSCSLGGVFIPPRRGEIISMKLILRLKNSVKAALQEGMARPSKYIRGVSMFTRSNLFMMPLYSAWVEDVLARVMYCEL